jgi:flagellar biogenesis protein FliO
MSRCFHRLMVLLVMSNTPAGLAQSTNTLTLHTDLPDLGVSALRIFAALAIVLAVFFAGVWLFRNGQRIAWHKTGAPKLAILETRPLGNRFALYVVGYEQQRVLVGSSPAGLNLLSQLPSAAQTNNQIAVPAENATFMQCLQRVLKPK